MHRPPPNLPRFGGGERPPILYKPIAPLTITMGQRLVLSTSPISLRALNFPFSIARPSGPLSRIGKGGGGKGQMPPQATLGAYLCAVRIDFGLPSKINPYPALQATGVLGQSPKRILPTFVRTKVGPRRVGVLTMISKRPAPPLGDNKFFYAPPAAVQSITFYKTFPTEGDYKLSHAAPPAGVQIKTFCITRPTLGDCKWCHVHLPESTKAPPPQGSFIQGSCGAHFFPFDKYAHSLPEW